MGDTLYDMLVILVANYYDEENIFQAYQNNFVLPSHSKYIIITELDTTNISRPNTSFTGSLPEGTRHIDNMDVTNFQFDFYGSPARQMATGVRGYLQSHDGCDYLAAKGNITIYQVKNMQNLTLNLDQRKYLERFTFTFSVFNNNSITYDMYGFDHIDPEFILVK